MSCSSGMNTKSQMVIQDLHMLSYFLLCKVCPKTILQILYIFTVAPLIKTSYSTSGYKNALPTVLVVSVHDANVCEPQYHQDYSQFYLT
jgi:hypothetical protein